MTEVAEAERLILEHLPILGVSREPLADCAERAFEIAGTQAAGAPPLALGGPRRCVEVMTGAMLPRGADTVIPVERITRTAGTAKVEPQATINSGQYVHRRGSDLR